MSAQDVVAGSWALFDSADQASEEVPIIHNGSEKKNKMWKAELAQPSSQCLHMGHLIFQEQDFRGT
jgi:hypothetical protein